MIVPFNKNSVRHVELPPDFVRNWIGVVFLSAPAICELFSVQGSMHDILLCRWPAERAMLWSILLPTALSLVQDICNAVSSTAGGEETMHGHKHGGIVFLSCLFLMYPKRSQR